MSKQGKLKRKIPKRELLKLAKERVQNNQPSEATDKELEAHPYETDIPLHETDYEYFANPDRDLGFLTAIQRLVCDENWCSLCSMIFLNIDSWFYGIVSNYIIQTFAAK